MSGKKEKAPVEETAPEAVTELEQLLGAMEDRVARLHARGRTGPLWEWLAEAG